MKTIDFNFTLYFILILLAVGVMSCSDEDSELSIETKDIAVDEAELDAVFEDIDDFTSIRLETTQENIGGKIEDEIEDDRICDGVINFEGNRFEGTLILDFGDGCIDAEGNVRSGRIIITYEGLHFVPGSITTLTLEDYTINGMSVEGVRTVENITTDGPLTWNIVLTGGQVTYEDGTVATRESNRIRVWERATSPIGDRILVTGTASGQTKTGTVYNSRISEELVFLRSCRRGWRARIPVSGINVITTDVRTITIEYGDGECNRRISTIADGISEDITL